MNGSYSYGSYKSGTKSRNGKNKNRTNSGGQSNGGHTPSKGTRGSGSRSSSSTTAGAIDRVEDNKEQETQHDILRQLCQALSSDERPLVWYRTQSQSYCAAQIVAREPNKSMCLIKVMTNQLMLLNKTCLLDEVPQDVSPDNVGWVMTYLSNLTTDFEIRADIVYKVRETGWMGSSMKQVAQEIVVKEWKLPFSKTGQIEVRDVAVTKTWTRKSVEDLKVVTASLASSSTNDEELRKCNDVLARSELENKKVQQQKADLEEQLSMKNAQIESQQDEMSAQERRHAHEISRRDDEKNQMSRSNRTSMTQKDKEMSKMRKKLSQNAGEMERLKQTAGRNRNDIEQLKRQRDAKEAEKRELNGELERRETEVARQTGELEKMKTTMKTFEEMQRQQRQEIQGLRGEVDEKCRRVRELEQNLPVYEHQERMLTAERANNGKLREQLEEKDGKLAEFVGGSLLSEYSSVNFCKEMAELRNEKHDEAVDACTEDLELSSSEAFDVLFRIFMLCYGYFEEKLGRIRTLLNLTDDDEMLERLFVIKMQDHYKKIFDGQGLERAYLTEFSQELGAGVSDPRVLAYVRGCGELCWCVAIYLPKLHFLPRENWIDPDDGVMFDSSKFKDFAGQLRKNDTARVVSYVLPGLYRVDSDAAIGADALPCVYTEKIKPPPQHKAVAVTAQSSATRVVSRPKPRTGQRSDEEVLEAVAADVWNGDARDAKDKLKSIGWYTRSLEIRCGDESCDAVLFQSWGDYERAAARGDMLECPLNDVHDNVRICKKKW